MKQPLALSLVFLVFASARAQVLINPNFGTNGKTLVNLRDKSIDGYIPSALRLFDDGSIMLGGAAVVEETLVQKINSAGIDDASFGIKGFKYFDFGYNFNNTVEDLIPYSDGKTLIVGHHRPNISSTNKFTILDAVTVVRLMPDGNVDTSFGMRGKAIFMRNNFSTRGYNAAVQADGKIVVACRGSITTNTSPTFTYLMFVRFNANGSLDSTYGTQGFFEVPEYHEAPQEMFGKSSMAIQPDGKVVYGDFSGSQPYPPYFNDSIRPAIFRVTPQGKLDSSFAVNGKFLNLLGLGYYEIYGLTLQPDGKILASGAIINSSSKVRWLIFRLTSNGHVDSAFASNGVFAYAGPGWVDCTVGQISMQGNDKILVSATHKTSTTSVLDVFRLNLDGKFDSTFSQTKGFFQKDLPSGHRIQLAPRLSVNSANEIAALAFGFKFPNNAPISTGHVLARLTSDGIPKITFNGSGYRMFDSENYSTIPGYAFGTDDRLMAAVQFNDGKIMLIGHRFQAGGVIKELSIARLTALGKVDSSFSTDGKDTLYSINNYDRTTLALKLSDDKVLIDQNETTLLKFDENAKIDSSFGTNGRAQLNLPPSGSGYNAIKAIAEQPDKKIVALTAQYLYRLLPNGVLDASFGTNGIKKLTPYSPQYGDEKGKLKIMPDGKILGGFSYAFTDFYVELFRCNPDGSMDLSFGGANNGFADVRPGSARLYEPRFGMYFEDFQALPNGKIIVVCLKDRTDQVPNPRNPEILAAGANYRDIMLYGFTADGKVDSSFGGYPNAGYIGTSHFMLPFTEEYPGKSALTPDGKLLVSGYFDRGTGWDIGLLQLNQQGKFDSSCGFGGMQTLGFDNVVQWRFPGNLPLLFQPLRDGSYLLTGTQLGQNADFFAVNVLGSNSAFANITWQNIASTVRDSVFDVELNWSTTGEMGTTTFELQISTDSVNFHTVQSLVGAGTGSKNYRVTIPGLTQGKYYFRLLVHGTFCRQMISQMKIFNVDHCQEGFAIYPNPVTNNELTIVIPACQEGDLRIINTLGQIIRIIRNPGHNKITINCITLPSATYFIQFVGGKKYVKKFIKL